MLKVPFRPGDAWLWDAGEGQRGTKTVAGVKRVKVPAGTFEAVRVDSE